ncbi:MAG: heavy-metal-associated domain-containing protein [Bacillota bacterium]
MMTMNLKINGMSCSHCEKRVAESLRKIGVAESTVSAKTGSARVTFDPAKISVPMLEKAVSDAGYQVVSATEACC